jgi:thiosulfate dehydrogenase [quinone] large subunit
VLTTVTSRAAAIDQRAQGAVLGAGRIIVGLMWLANLHWKVPPDFGQDSGGGLFKYSASVSRHSPFAPFTWVTEQIILPNFAFFGWVTLIAETIVAALLLIGYQTKLAALTGAALAVPILLSVIYYDRADEWSWSYLLMIAAHLLIYASGAGRAIGLDGVLGGGRARLVAAQRVLGAVLAGLGLAGLYVARSMDFAGRRVALLGSDAGFVNDAGDLTRRWELKFLWFNPSLALMTIALGVAVLAGIRWRWAAWAAGIWLVVAAVVALAFQRFDYARDDGVDQVISAASNAAVWGGLGLAVLLVDRARHQRETSAPDSAPA